MKTFVSISNHSIFLHSVVYLLFLRLDRATISCWNGQRIKIQVLTFIPKFSGDVCILLYSPKQDFSKSFPKFYTGFSLISNLRPKNGVLLRCLSHTKPFFFFISSIWFRFIFNYRRFNIRWNVWTKSWNDFSWSIKIQPFEPASSNIFVPFFIICSIHSC